MDNGTELHHVNEPVEHIDDINTTSLDLKRLRGLSWPSMGGEGGASVGGGGCNADSEGRGTDGGAAGESSQDETEFDFVSAIFELGLRHASPKIVMMLINAPSGTELTTEHIKSHLQKFRQHYARSPSDFANYVNLSLRPQYERFLEGKSAEALLAQSYNSHSRAKRSRHEPSGQRPALNEVQSTSADVQRLDLLSVSNGNHQEDDVGANGNGANLNGIDVSLSSEDGGGKSNHGVLNSTDELVTTAVEGSPTPTPTLPASLKTQKEHENPSSGTAAELTVYHRIIEAILENEDELASLQAKEAELVKQHLEVQANLQRHYHAQLRPQRGGDSSRNSYVQGYPADNSALRGSNINVLRTGSNGGVTLGAINLEHASSRHHAARGGDGSGGLIAPPPSAPLLAGGAEDLDRSLGGSLGWGISHPLRPTTGPPSSAAAPSGQPPSQPLPRYDQPEHGGRPPQDRFQQGQLSQERTTTASSERSTQDRLPRTASAHALAAVTAAAAIVARGLDDSMSSQRSDHVPPLMPQHTRPPYFAHSQQRPPYCPPQHQSPPRGSSQYPPQNQNPLYASPAQPHAHHHQQQQLPASSGHAAGTSRLNHPQNPPTGPPLPQLPKAHGSPNASHPLGNLQDAVATILKIQRT